MCHARRGLSDEHEPARGITAALLPPPRFYGGLDAEDANGNGCGTAVEEGVEGCGGWEDRVAAAGRRLERREDS